MDSPGTINIQTKFFFVFLAHLKKTKKKYIYLKTDFLNFFYIFLHKNRNLSYSFEIKNNILDHFIKIS